MLRSSPPEYRWGQGTHQRASRHTPAISKDKHNYHGPRATLVLRLRRARDAALGRPVVSTRP
eukprot:940042-Pyramimonas_sp.AAC.1